MKNKVLFVVTAASMLRFRKCRRRSTELPNARRQAAASRRSENLNTEIGFLVESEALANAVADSIVGDMGPGNAWRVRLNDDGDTEWVTIQDGEETIEPDSEPLSSGGRKLKADLAQPFTPEAQM